MNILLITKEEAIIKEAKAAYQSTDQLAVFSDWKTALDKCKGAELMIVDLISTLKNPNKIDGYEEFAASKMAHDVASAVPLVLIAAPDDYDIDSMVGWPDFVFGHVRRPVTMKIFRRISTWV